MRKLIEDILVSLDGVYAGAAISRFSEYRRDEAYIREELEQALACDALLMGRTTYEDVSKVWPILTDPWAGRINAMPKYVFSSTLERADWNNCTIVRGDVVAEVTRLKQQEGGDLLIYGHGLLGETLLKHHLLDTFSLSISPLVLKQGKQLFQQVEPDRFRLVEARGFPKGMVKLTYEPQY